MAKYRPKTPYSSHCKYRYKQRFTGEQELEDLARRGRHYGITPDQVPPEFELRHFLEGKELKRRKMVKLLDGYVLIYSRSGRMMTLYQLPEWLKADYESVKHIEKKNREAYRRMKKMHKNGAT